MSIYSLFFLSKITHIFSVSDSYRSDYFSFNLLLDRSSRNEIRELNSVPYQQKRKKRLILHF